MAVDSLGEFLELVHRSGELVRIAAPVEAALELAEITDRLQSSADESPALVFDAVRGSSVPVVTNLLGSRRRLCLAAGVAELNELATRLQSLLQPGPAGGWLDALKLTPQSSRWARLAPKVIRTAPAQQVVKLGRDVDLWELPALRSWPGEPQVVFTAAQVHIAGNELGTRFTNWIPAQIADRQRLALHAMPQHVLAQEWRRALTERRQIPVTVTLGGDPACLIAAGADLPWFNDPYVLAGLLRDAPLELVRCRTLELEVPAHAEVIMEGVLDSETPAELAPPIATESGWYSRPRAVAQMRVTAITHRAQPILPAVVRGRAVGESYWLRHLWERALLPVVRLLAPAILDYHFPTSGRGRGVLFIRVEKRYPYQARNLLNLISGLPRFQWAKTLVAVDAEISVQQERDVWAAVAANVDPQRDTWTVAGTVDGDDHATERWGAGSRLFIDATRKLPAEGGGAEWPARLNSDPEIARVVGQRWSEYGLPLSDG